MAYKYETTRRVESIECPGVSFVLRKMTEGRRLDLRSKMTPLNVKVRELLKEQNVIDQLPSETRDLAKWMDLQEQIDQIVLEHQNPIWITWGVKQIEGLECDGEPLGIDDWLKWPSMLANEIVAAVRNESELNGSERKNSESLSTSGEPEAEKPKLSIVQPASVGGSGETETVGSSSQAE